MLSCCLLKLSLLASLCLLIPASSAHYSPAPPAPPLPILSALVLQTEAAALAKLEGISVDEARDRIVQQRTSGGGPDGLQQDLARVQAEYCAPTLSVLAAIALTALAAHALAFSAMHTPKATLSMHTCT